MQRREHWNTVYNSKGEQQTSWYEAVPSTSFRMLESAGLNSDKCVVDVGGGDSRLVDGLIRRGVRCIAVIDVSASALARGKSRLGSAAAIPTWLEADVTGDWALQPMDIWHDRAVFHFLTSDDDRRRYRSRLLSTLKPGGSAIIATFALDGPESCSGLPVRRYSAATLAAEFEPDLRMIESLSHSHVTPWGSQQSFVYCRFQRI